MGLARRAVRDDDRQPRRTFRRLGHETGLQYRSGDVDDHSATIYVGSTYSEPLPHAFLDDVLTSRRPVLWAGANIGELEQRAGNFAARYGWEPKLLDRAPISEVGYKDTSLCRWSTKPVGS